MTLKYESELLFELMKRDGDDAPSDVLPYESELKEKYLEQVVGAYPKLQDYRPEWLHYNLYHHLPTDFLVEQGTFAESTPPNTQTYEQIKLGTEALYDIRLRTKGTYKVVQGATYEVQLNDGYAIFVCFCKNGLYSAPLGRWIEGTGTTFTVPNDCDEMFFSLKKTDNSVITPSDYPRIGLKIHL